MHTSFNARKETNKDNWSVWITEEPKAIVAILNEKYLVDKLTDDLPFVTVTSHMRDKLEHEYVKADYYLYQNTIIRRQTDKVVGTIFETKFADAIINKLNN